MATNGPRQKPASMADIDARNQAMGDQAMERVPDNGFDEFDPDALAGLVCHIEMDTKGERTPRAVAASTAKTLRKLATAIESGFFDTGHFPITGEQGENVGELYLDFYGEG